MSVKVHLTRYEELPNIPLLLDQVLLLANQAVADLTTLTARPDSDEQVLTSSMVNNYVKRGLVRAPVKKRYERDQVCQLIWVCLLKQVMDLKGIDAYLKAVSARGSLSETYNSFCDDVEALIDGNKPQGEYELGLAAAQAVASQTRLLQLIVQLQPADCAASDAENEA